MVQGQVFLKVSLPFVKLCHIRAGGSCMRVEGTVENTLKEGGTEKRRGETKIF